MEDMNLQQLIGKLKTEDTSYANISKVMQIMYWIFIPLFAFSTVHSYLDSKNFDELIGGICFILSFLIFALFFRRYYKEYKYVDYSLPTLVMLKKAAYRYQPFQLRMLWILLAIVFMDIGLSIETGPDFSMVSTQLVFLGALTLAVFIGLLVYRIKYKPVRDHVLKLIAEIEGNSNK